MASRKKVNPELRTNNDTGFGTNANSYGGRFVNKDGTFNLRREGVSLMQSFSIYQKMLNLPRWKFIFLILLFYFTINVFFTIIYLLIGMNQLQGLNGHSTWEKIKETFFFSTQTFTTVGYGRINPAGDLANMASSIEALTGFLSFAIATGLIYGRFARPRSYLMFSQNALISPYREGTGLMFRFAPYKDHHVLTNVEIKVSLALQVEENGRQEFRFYNLSLERYKVDSLPMNWTVVHAIDEQSPLKGFTYSDLVAADLELYVLVTGFDDIYSSPVLQRTSYTYHEIKMNAKFIPMYRESEDGKTTILELNKLNHYKEVELVLNSDTPVST